MSEIRVKPNFQLNEKQAELKAQIADKAQELLDLIQSTHTVYDKGVKGERETAIAITNLEQSVMWGVKGATFLDE